MIKCVILPIQNTSKKKERRILNFLENDKKIKAPRQLVQLCIWCGGLGFFKYG